LCISASLCRFQGEQNSGNPTSYACTFPAAIVSVETRGRAGGRLNRNIKAALIAPSGLYCAPLLQADWRAKFDAPNTWYGFVLLEPWCVMCLGSSSAAMLQRCYPRMLLRDL